MVGGTIFHRRVIQREISRVLVLNLSGNASGAKNTAGEKFALDIAFALIDGHPNLCSQHRALLLDSVVGHTIAVMARAKKESGRSRRRQPRRGFPHRIVAYLDTESKRLVDAALEVAGENTSMFTAKALVERAERVLNEQGKSQIR